MTGKTSPPDIPDEGQLLIPRKPISSFLSSDETEVAPSTAPTERDHRARRWINEWPNWISLYRILEYGWFVEISSIITAWLAFFAIIVTLLTHNNQPMPNWPRWISLNSIVAILTAVIKGALVMPVAQGLGQLKWNWYRTSQPLLDLDRLDAASRGPWGAVLLLMTRFRRRLAGLGALIILLALVIDPFSQQVVQYGYCQRTLPGMVGFISSATDFVNFGTYAVDSKENLDPQLTNAIYSGIIQPPANASVNIAFSCATGNCTFPNDGTATHKSLAMCGRCEDFTHALDIKDNVHYSFDPQQAWSALKPSSIAIQRDSNVSMDSTSSWLSARSYAPSDENSKYIVAIGAIMSSNCSCITDTSVTNSSVGGAAKMLHISSCQCQPFAGNCMLYPCVKTYKSMVKNGILEESQLPTILGPAELFAGKSFTWIANQTYRQGQPRNCVASSQRDAETPLSVVSKWVNIGGFYNPVWEYYAEGCVLSLDWDSVQKIQSVLRDLWTGSLYRSWGAPEPAEALGNIALQNIFNAGQANLTTLNTYIEGIANSLTAVIRQYGTAPSVSQVTGSVMANQTCIIVHWYWLCIPGTLLILGAIFIWKTVKLTKSQQTTMWKSSALALLFHGLEPEVQTKYQSLVHVKHMLGTAEATEARLEGDASGWRFVVK